MDYVRPADRLRGELTEFVGRRAELVLVRQALSSARLASRRSTGTGACSRPPARMWSATSNDTDQFPLARVASVVSSTPGERGQWADQAEQRPDDVP